MIENCHAVCCQKQCGWYKRGEWFYPVEMVAKGWPYCPHCGGFTNIAWGYVYKTCLGSTGFWPFKKVILIEHSFTVISWGY